MGTTIAMLLLSYIGPKLLVKFGGGPVLSLVLKGITAAVKATANAPPLTAEEKRIVKADRAQRQQEIGGPMDR